MKNAVSIRDLVRKTRDTFFEMLAWGVALYFVLGPITYDIIISKSKPQLSWRDLFVEGGQAIAMALVYFVRQLNISNIIPQGFANTLETILNAILEVLCWLLNFLFDTEFQCNEPLPALGVVIGLVAIATVIFLTARRLYRADLIFFKFSTMRLSNVALPLKRTDQQ